jgi:hypothetical protein
VLSYGVNNIELALNEDFNLTSLTRDETLAYLTKRIDYRLDVDKVKALQLFLNYIKQL